jgi:DNA modification methylase
MAKARPSKRTPPKPRRPPREARAAAVPPAPKEPAKQEVTVTAAKGRPMLTWVGKRPLRHVTAFPAQLVEVFDPAGDAAKRPGGLLYHGDNKEVLAHLLANGWRGKVDLVYIDPPFDSGADYVRKVSLRGPKGTVKLDGEGYTLGEQIQYTDIWANDNYLQFMYERLILIREVMAPDSVIYVHTDSTRGHQIRHLMDEVFGAESFRNEIVWWYWNKMQGNINRFASNHDTLLCYGQGTPTFFKIREEREELIRQLKRVWDPATNSLVNAKDEKGNLIYIESEERTVDDVWRISMLQPADQTENLRFPTQKPEELLSIAIGSSSRPGDFVLDCFMGSGTTVAVAQKLGRRWIGCDVNKGAIQTTSKRIQAIIRDQIEAAKAGEQMSMVEGEERKPPGPAQLSFAVHRVNDYDLQIQHVEAVNLACEHIGVERRRTDTYFDGTLGKRLVKVVPFNHPLTPLDLDELRRELESRPEEDRDAVVVCLGKDPASDAWIEDWNRLRKGKEAVNRISVIELRTDPKYGKFFAHQPARARVGAKRKGDSVVIEIRDFLSPTIVERLAEQTGILRPKIDDWRAMVDCVLIDPAYDGNVFRIALSDVPVRKTDLVSGRYELAADRCGEAVAVKIADMLGEEVLEVLRLG